MNTPNAEYIRLKTNIPKKRTVIYLIVLTICSNQTFGQYTNDSANASSQDSSVIINDTKNSFNYRTLIVPAVLIGYGAVSLESDGLKQLNYSTRDEINEHQPRHIRLDNYAQYAPAFTVYGLNTAGIKGRHNFRDRTIIYSTSQLITMAIVVPLKHIVNQERPDGTNFLSFPSGHTATAFSSAQFMFREYKDTNFWLGISGYPFAVFTGVYRTLNDKHWVSDVVTGAGFGILSTELAYWIYPKVNSLFSGKNKDTSTMIMPSYKNKGLGIDFVKSF